ncbi:MAG: hypothetical protein IT270_09020 [Saprospiraceae bacterium]|nr:hypothetical protein [Saprospiraceae bacterium]
MGFSYGMEMPISTVLPPPATGAYAAVDFSLKEKIGKLILRFGIAFLNSTPHAISAVDWL